MITIRAASESISIASPSVGIVAPIPELPRLLWHDEFDGASIDSTIWNVRNAWVGGNESSICWARNAFIANGALVIQPRREVSTAQGVTRQYTSAYLDTHGKRSIPKPSYTEIRGRLPLARYVSRGMWPAFWFRLARGSLEIDGMEAWGTPSDRADTWGRFQFAIWPNTMSNTNGYHGWYVPSAQDLTQWHSYGLRIDADGTISFRYDGAPVAFDQWSGGVCTRYDKITPAMISGLAWDQNVDQLGLRVNLQIGQPSYYGDPDANTDFSQRMIVDHVRVWTLAA